jgi:hypothetical protein
MRSGTEQHSRQSVLALAALRYDNEPGRSDEFDRAYRRYAADCLKMVQSATNDGDKARLLQMAETWRHLAELEAAKAAARDDGDK